MKTELPLRLSWCFPHFFTVFTFLSLTLLISQWSLKSEVLMFAINKKVLVNTLNKKGVCLTSTWKIYLNNENEDTKSNFWPRRYAPEPLSFRDTCCLSAKFKLCLLGRHFCFDNSACSLATLTLTHTHKHNPYPHRGGKRRFHKKELL